MRCHTRVIRDSFKLWEHRTTETLLLRGAVVEGKLDFDPKLELSNLTKQLPWGDVLYRAIDLEIRNKGARIAIEKKLAQKILPREWYTLEG